MTARRGTSSGHVSIRDQGAGGTVHAQTDRADFVHTQEQNPEQNSCADMSMQPTTRGFPEAQFGHSAYNKQTSAHNTQQAEDGTKY